MSISGDAIYLEKEYREETDISECIISEAGFFFLFCLTAKKMKRIYLSRKDYSF